MYMEQELICSRRRGVAVVKTMDGRKFDIFGRISSEKLSKETHYSTYLVHRLSPKHGHCDLSFKGVCRFVDNEGRDEAESRVWPYYVPSTVSRDDGWLETKIGSFFNVGGNLGDVEPCLFSVMLQCHRFLSVLGLEFRAGTTSGGMADWGFCEEFLEEKAKF
ncbi:unnamed protein product [Cuscuta epithymum]|uniref:Uncharacterized protein n=1 Tax=Cuscuta epithymum TaxID=186058 RepID=A0AAV0CW30_9ASTE|nr:unnamed protein product [Cuscuta epithymum]